MAGAVARVRGRSVCAFYVALLIHVCGCEAIVTEPDLPDGALPRADAGAPMDATAAHGDGAVNVGPITADGSVATDSGLAVQPGLDASVSTPDAGTGSVDAATMTMAEPEGRLNGLVAAHNRVRAAVTTTPALAPLTWSADIAAFAQQWADSLALTCNIMHRTQAMLQPKDYGENIATFGISGGSASPSNAQKAVDGWAAEKTCWTYGTLSGLGVTGTERCDATCYKSLSSDGCGHYTAIVSRRSTQLGCGVSTCKMGGTTFDIWVCNYSPAGNFVGRTPY